ncbi:MAG: hypothetical protein DWQ01_11145 [Planctomycetota bacterium]|nr:MAG: hypothetical protein DWQ01_11145 [Planctomycetota bacterium]
MPVLSGCFAMPEDLEDFLDSLFYGPTVPGLIETREGVHLSIGGLPGPLILDYEAMEEEADALLPPIDEMPLARRKENAGLSFQLETAEGELFRPRDWKFQSFWGVGGPSFISQVRVESLQGERDLFCAGYFVESFDQRIAVVMLPAMLESPSHERSEESFSDRDGARFEVVTDQGAFVYEVEIYLRDGMPAEVTWKKTDLPPGESFAWQPDGNLNWPLEVESFGRFFAIEDVEP